MWQFVSHLARATSWIYLHDLWLFDWVEILHEWSLVCQDNMWIVLGFSMAFSIWLIIFFTVGSFCNIVWHMFVYLLWNSHMVLDECEIWYADYRHIVGHHAFDPIHFLICCHCFVNFWSECMCWCYELAWIIVSGFLDFYWPSLYQIVHEMKMVDDMSMGPIAFAFDLC